ncbi:MAG: hypothetical protein ABIJ09_13230 [Pseudomonadota bacterium]
MTRLSIILAAVTLLACEPNAELRRRSTAPTATTLWHSSLQADTEMALRDASRPGLRYPNPLGCHSLEVELARDGSLCGRCERGDRDVEVCGGPERGLPHLVQAEVMGSALALRLLDLFGTPIDRFERVANVCVEVTSGEGRRCQLCSDARGEVLRTECRPQHDPVAEELSEENQPHDDGSSDEPTVEELSEENQPHDDGNSDEPMVEQFSEENPPHDDGNSDEPMVEQFSEENPPHGDGSSDQPTVEQLSEENPPHDDGSSDEPAVEVLGEQEQPHDATDDSSDDEPIAPAPPAPAQANAEDCYRTAVEHFVSKLDDTLVGAGLPPSGLRAEDVVPNGASADLGRRTCAGELNWFEPNDVYLTDAGLRCAGLGTDTARDTCDAEPVTCQEQKTAYETGVGAAYTTWVLAASKAREPALDGADESSPSVDPELPVCTGSPLVVELEPGQLALSILHEGVEFDLLGSGHAVQTGWVRGGALLALDLDGDGCIGSGRELFGEASVLPDGSLARDGFAALARYDLPGHGGNGDGRIDASDTVYEQLLLWQDLDQDGVSQPDELRPARHALASLELAATRAAPLGARSGGHDVALSASAQRLDGGQATIYDVWFRYTSAPVPQS